MEMHEGTGNPADQDEKKRRRNKSPGIYWHLDMVTEYLLYAVLVFTPWAFATTESWAIQTVNALNYALGLLLVGKWVVRGVTGFRPVRWDGPGSGRGVNSLWITVPLAVLTVTMLGYMAVSAWNARADYLPTEQRLEFFTDFNKNLPTSYDRSATWWYFRMYLAVACFFWAVRDWVRTQTRREVRSEDEVYGPAVIGPESPDHLGNYSYDPSRFPTRLKRLLWVICGNGAALAIQGTLQRLSGSNELLWMVRPIYNAFSWQQFGPFNYRSNAAQYLNLIWPVCLAFWWALNQQRRKKIGEGAETMLLLFAGLMLAAPMIASSRGGVAIAAAEMIGVVGIFAYSFRKGGWWKTALVAMILVVIAGSSAALQWSRLQGRFNENTLNTLNGRTVIYDNAKKIVEDYPGFGTGAGTFGVVYQMYRADPLQSRFAFAHDDFLQTVVTFGRIGFTALCFMLVLVFAYWFIARGVPTSELFVAFLWLSTGGCLLHARFDFPLQIYAILLLFMTQMAILTVLARRS